MNSICVIGSINKDITILVQQLPKNSDTIYAQNVIQKCGGKGANAAIALSKLGVHTLFYGCIGRDGHGIELKMNLEKYGISPRHLSIKDSSSGIAYIVLDEEGRNRIIVVPGANEEMTKTDIINRAYPLIKKSEITLTQLETSEESIQEIVSICKKEDKKLIVVTSPTRNIKADFLSNIFCVCSNAAELSALFEKEISTTEEITAAAECLLNMNVQQVIVRLGHRGCLFFNHDTKLYIPAYPVKAVDPTAASDSFIAGYCKCLLEKKSVKAALKYAAKCGAFAVTRIGAISSLPTAEDIENLNF